MKALIKLYAGIALGFTSAGLHAAPACDERIAITNPDRIPFQWIAGQRHDNDDDGIYEFISSGTLVGPHLSLTCGHCVYNRTQGYKAPGTFTVVPAMYRDDATNAVVYPHGSRDVYEDAHKVTNSKWTDLAYSPKTNVDYGGLKIVCPFEDITTYMPVVFDYNPSLVNMSGYPTADLPAPGTTLDQYRDAGPINSVIARQLDYEVRSTGGASGAPVWVYNAADGRRQVGVNVAHSNSCNGIASRLVWNNENLIESWMSWTPSLSERNQYGCPGLVAQQIDFSQLQDIYRAGHRPLLSAQRLKLTTPPQAPMPQQPAQRVYQWIENTFYAWDEYVDIEGLRYLEMVKPEQRLLTTTQAQVLLTASQGWQQQRASGEHTTIGPDLTETARPQPVVTASDHKTDHSHDQDTE